MNSSISHFKAWLLVLLIVLGIEMIYLAFMRPHEMDRTNLLQFSFATPETAQRLFTWHKMRAFGDSEPHVVQVGDSSGFHGIDPLLVEAYLPPGTRYVNMSCCANQGFRGYINVLKYMLDRNEGIRYAILHITPHTMPRPEMWDADGAALWGDANITVFGEAIGKEVNAPWSWFRVPTLAARGDVTHTVYYFGDLFRSRDAPMLDAYPYLEFLDLFRKHRGWTPENDVQQYIDPQECKVHTPKTFDWRSFSRKTYIEVVFPKFAALARRHNIKLVVVFQPVGCQLGDGAGSQVARDGLRRFMVENPDVAVPFPLIETWDPARFSVPAHVHTEWVPETSRRLGEALRDIMKADGFRPSPSEGAP